MNVWLENDKSVEKDFSVIGKTFEHNANVIRFHVTEEMMEKEFYLEFEKSNGEKGSTPKLEIKYDEEHVYGDNIVATIITDRYVDFSVPNSLLDIPGTFKLEVVLRDGTTWKSNTIYLHVLEAINASEEYVEKYPDFIKEAQSILDECEKQNQIFTDTGDGTKFLADDGTYKIVKSGEEISVSDFQKALENISENKIGYECKTINEVLQGINRFYSKAKIVVNATDSVSGEVLNASFTITGLTKEDDGYYYLMASDTTYAVMVTCSGYVTQRIQFTVTDEEANAGIKVIEVQMVART